MGRYVSATPFAIVRPAMITTADFIVAHRAGRQLYAAVNAKIFPAANAAVRPPENNIHA